MNKTELRRAKTTLKKAKGLLEKYGWLRGRLGDKQSGFCAWGALRESCNDYDCVRLYDARALFAKVTKPENGIGEWNDKKSRTKRQVLAAFDRAIGLADKELTCKSNAKRPSK